MSSHLPVAAPSSSFKKKKKKDDPSPKSQLLSPSPEESIGPAKVVVFEEHTGGGVSLDSVAVAMASDPNLYQFTVADGTERFFVGEGLDWLARYAASLANDDSDDVETTYRAAAAAVGRRLVAEGFLSLDADAAADDETAMYMFVSPQVNAAGSTGVHDHSENSAEGSEGDDDSPAVSSSATETPSTSASSSVSVSDGSNTVSEDASPNSSATAAVAAAASGPAEPSSGALVSAVQASAAPTLSVDPAANSALSRKARTLHKTSGRKNLKDEIGGDAAMDDVEEMWTSAIERNDAAQLQMMLKRAPTYDDVPSPTNSATMSIGHRAALFGSIEVARAFASDEAYALSRDARGSLPLHYAAMMGHAGVCAVLAAAHPRTIDMVDDAGYSPLGYSCFDGQQESLAALIDALAAARLPLRLGSSLNCPLRVLVRRGHVQILEWLLAPGSVARRAAAAEGSGGGDGANASAVFAFDWADDKGLLLLHEAARSGHTGILSVLLQEYAEVNTLDMQGRSPLFHAVDAASSECVKLLLTRGASVLFGAEREGEAAYLNPLVQCARKDTVDLFTLLFRHFKDLNGMSSLKKIGDSSRNSVLHVACLSQATGVCKVLLKKRYPVDLTNVRGESPLHCCAISGATDCATLLLRAGCSLSTRDEDGRTALSVALSRPASAAVAAEMCRSKQLTSELQRTLLLADLVTISSTLRPCFVFDVMADRRRSSSGDSGAATDISRASAEALNTGGASQPVVGAKPAGSGVSASSSATNVSGGGRGVPRATSTSATAALGRHSSTEAAEIEGPADSSAYVNLFPVRLVNVESNLSSVLTNAVWKFNAGSQRKSVDDIVEHLLPSVPKERHSVEIAGWLHRSKDLGKAQIADYLGDNNPRSAEVLQAYMDLLEFSNCNLSFAIRKLCSSIFVQGEAQKIDRILHVFGSRYFASQAGAFREMFANSDTVYVLAYSCIMLNTDAHHPQVKNRMTKDEFVRNNRGINDGADLPRTFLESLYVSIVESEIRIPNQDIEGRFRTAIRRCDVLIQDKKKWQRYFLVLLSDSAAHLYAKVEDDRPKAVFMVREFKAEVFQASSHQHCLKFTRVLLESDSSADVGAGVQSPGTARRSETAAVVDAAAAAASTAVPTSSRRPESRSPSSVGAASRQQKQLRKGTPRSEATVLPSPIVVDFQRRNELRTWMCFVKLVPDAKPRSGLKNNRTKSTIF